jgi:uroporphyrinogen-III synthase
MRLIVTRPAAQAEASVQALRALGQDAVALPLIGIAAVADTGPLREAWERLPGCAMAMFVSANAVQHFFAVAPAPWPAGVLAGATGPGTVAALRQAGVPAEAVVAPPDDAPRFDSEALWQLLAAHDWAACRVLIVRGEDGRDWLADTLRRHDAEVDFVAAYRRLPPTLDGAQQAVLDAALAAPAAALWLFSSSEAVGHLRALAPAADWGAGSAIASHPRIAQAARDAGFGRVELAAPTPEAVAALAARWPSIHSAP